MTIFRRRVANQLTGVPQPQETTAVDAKRFVENTGDRGLRTERRRYFRVYFPQPLQAMMSIVEIEGRQIVTGKAEVFIEDMGPGGLRIKTGMRLPHDRQLVLEITTHLLEEEITVIGKLLGMREVKPGSYEYDLEFDIDEKERMKLTGLLNIVQARMRRKTFAENRSVEERAKRYPKVG